MVIYKNKASGKSFILLRERGPKFGYFMAPETESGDICCRELEYKLFFDDPIEIRYNDDVMYSTLSKKQIEAFFSRKARIERLNAGREGIIEGAIKSAKSFIACITIIVGEFIRKRRS